METYQQSNSGTESHGKNRSILVGFLDTLIRWRLFLLTFLSSALVISVIIVLLIPRWYKAEASVLPPQGGGLLGLSGGLSSMLGSISPELLKGTGLTGGSSSLTYLAILNSRTVMEDVVNKFDLMKVYDISDNSMDKAVKELRQNTNADIDENNAIVISVYDKDSQRAASMANHFVSLLNDIYVKLSIEEARNQRLFIEQRYEKNLSDLKGAEDSLRDFQERFKVYSLPEQTRAAISAGASLEAEAISKEVELGVLQSQYGEQAPQVALQRLQIREIQKKLLEMQSGDALESHGLTSLLPAFSQVPELAVSYLRLYRDVEIQTKLLEILMPMYEQAKIQEQKSTPAVYVLDQAVPPDRPSTPKRVFIVVLIGIFILALLIYFAHLFERLQIETGPLNPLEEKLRGFAAWSTRVFKVRSASQSTSV